MSVSWTSKIVMNREPEMFSFMIHLISKSCVYWRWDAGSLRDGCIGYRNWCCLFISQRRVLRVLCISPKCWEAKSNVCHLVIDLERLVRRATQNESWQCKCWRTLPQIRPCISRSVVQERTPPSAMPSMPDLCKVAMWVQILPLRLNDCLVAGFSFYLIEVKFKLVSLFSIRDSRTPSFRLHVWFFYIIGT